MDHQTGSRAHFHMSFCGFKTERRHEAPIEGRMPSLLENREDRTAITKPCAYVPCDHVPFVGATLVVAHLSAAQRCRETAFEGRMPSLLENREDHVAITKPSAT